MHDCILSKRQNETKKCPLSAPPKPSKPRIPKLALLSSVSRKLIDTKDTIQPPPKPITTPRARVKHVAAKYMTTPRIKKPIADSKPFNSVSNQPKTSSRILKPKLVAKALSFTSPKKAVKVKSLEDQNTTTPIKKLCSGMKKLEITDKKKVPLGNCQVFQELARKKFLATPKPKKRLRSLILRPKELHIKSVILSLCSVKLGLEISLVVESAYDQNPSSDEKENAPCSNINRDRNVNHGQSGGDNDDNNQKTFKKTTKAIQTINKSSLKENRSGGVGIQGVKYKRQKTTNPKPFRLRTDERSILKEATLERKQHEDENKVNINSTGKVRSEGRLKNGGLKRPRRIKNL